ncbi:Acetyl-coenzyme A synthetase [Hordeum vulgare]|nr:Acetyl-coenzyme A synthetase [Hordeum vulgare]
MPHLHRLPVVLSIASIKSWCLLLGLGTTYSQLLDTVWQLVNYVKTVRVEKGDSVVIYLPMLMELPIAMLACSRIGPVHSVVFAGFSADAIAQRITDCKSKVVITCNVVKRGLKLVPLKDIIDAALVESAKNGVTVGYS